MRYYPQVIDYDEPLFRPPSEAYSLIFQVTLGCSWNKCAFCDMYKSKRFTVRKEDEIIEEIKRAGEFYPGVRKIFLADGNAMVLPSEKLLRIIDGIKKSFPGVNRISTYALPRDILAKTRGELETLFNAGLELIYVGMESGDDKVLEMIGKGESSCSTMEGLMKAQESGMQTSVMVINGLAGSHYSEQHAINSAKVLNKIQPRYLSTLVLMVPFGVEKYKQGFKGTYEHMGVDGLIDEMDLFIRHLELERTVFRSDHASNFLILKGTLSRDKSEFLELIANARGMVSK